VFTSYGLSRRTPPITRRAAPLPEHDKRRVRGRVHWLVGRRHKPGITRSAQSPQAAPTTRELNHARCAKRNSFSTRPGPKPLLSVSRHQSPNAANHPPRGPIDLHDKMRVRGRVHALVRPRPAPKSRGARDGHNLRLPSQHGELNHAPPATRTCFPSVSIWLANPSDSSYARERPNARHHPPPRIFRGA
jgi:hypothetical protein